MNKEELASTTLRTEHKTILRVIDVLRRLVVRSESDLGFEMAAFRQCVDFFRFFADACHHAKEEDLLFPLLEANGIPREGGPIGVMLHEHTVDRKLTQEMSDALDQIESESYINPELFRDPARQYMTLLTQHIFKEDNILFNMGDQKLGEEDHQSLCQQFCEIECRAFGGKKKAELEAMATALEQS